MFCVIAHWNGTRSRVLFREGGAVGVDSLFEARVPFSRSPSLKRLQSPLNQSPRRQS
jgi:hypothetical protein